jgi:hypothetical protein
LGWDGWVGKGKEGWTYLFREGKEDQQNGWLRKEGSE